MCTDLITLEQLNYNEALRYMGCKDGKADKLTLSMLEECEQLVLENCIPRYRYAFFTIQKQENGIVVGNTTLLLTGNDISQHLEHCFGIVLLCATISGKIDTLIRTTQLSDMTKALIINSFSGVAIEQLCDKLEEEIHLVIQQKFPQCYTTWRYSPGYGDLPITLQKDILTVLDAPRKIGLCATESMTLTPIKSVTAVIGLSYEPVAPSKRGCSCCNLKNVCPFRKAGSHCVG